MSALSQALGAFAPLLLLLLFDSPVAADSSISVPTFTFGHFSDIYPSGYTPPPSPTMTLTGVFASQASVESEAASKASATGQASSGSLRGDGSPKNLYLNKVCQPLSGKGVPDQAFPCNRAITLVSACVFGDEFAKNASNAIAPPSPPPKERSSEDQQQCLCPGGKGQDYFQYYAGCNKCLELHGAGTKDAPGRDFKFYPAGLVKSVSSSYCAMAKPTQKYLAYVNQYIMANTVGYGTETGGVDKLSSKTDVGLYFSSTQVKAVPVTTGSSSNVSSSDPTTTAAAASTLATATSAQGPTSASSSAGTDSLKVSGLWGAGLLGIAMAL